MFVPSCCRISSYSLRTADSSLLFVASASLIRPLSAITRSFSFPNRRINLSKHRCAESSSPVWRHVTMRFSYMVHSSTVSAAEKRDTRGDAEKALGLLFRMVGACCARWRASAGDSWACGRASKAAMVPLWGKSDRVGMVSKDLEVI
jgi:hypothetical protein